MIVPFGLLTLFLIACFTPVKEIQHSYAKQEFERQVYGRMDSSGCSFDKMNPYTIEAEKHEILREELSDLQSKFPHIEGKVIFKSLYKGGNNQQNQQKQLEKEKKQPEKQVKQGKKQRALSDKDDPIPSDHLGADSSSDSADASPADTLPADTLPADASTKKSDTIETDLYVKITSSDEGASSLWCKNLLKDSSTEVTLINPRSIDESDVELHENDMLWMEVAETPQSMRSKLLQLERAVRYFDDNEQENSIIGRGAVMVCLNGEKGMFDECLTHLKNLYRKKELEEWKIISKRVPLFLTYTAYRNVHKSIADMADDVSEVKAQISALEAKIETDNAALEAKIEADNAALKAKIVEAVKTDNAALKTEIVEAVKTEMAETMRTILDARGPSPS